MRVPHSPTGPSVRAKVSGMLQTMALAILGLLTALLPLIIWYVKRKYSPTGIERQDDLADDVAAITAEIMAARRDGDDARADALLRRLRAQHAGEQRPSGTAGQCDSSNSATGNRD